METAERTVELRVSGGNFNGLAEAITRCRPVFTGVVRVGLAENGVKQ